MYFKTLMSAVIAIGAAWTMPCAWGQNSGAIKSSISRDGNHSDSALEGTPTRIAAEVIEAMCERNEAVWSVAEPINAAAATPAYDEHYTQCVYEFVAGGKWFSLRYDRSLRVPRRFAWRAEHRTLTILILAIDAADAQNGQRPLTYVMDDRQVRGRVTFGAIGTVGGTVTADHFYLPPDLTLDEDDCLAAACTQVGMQYAEAWQRRYEDALMVAHARLRPPPALTAAGRPNQWDGMN